MENPAPKSAARQIARAAGTVMFAMALSQIVGLIAKITYASSFGTQYDAFLAANRLPEMIVNLVAGGALASALIQISPVCSAMKNARKPGN